MAEHPDSVWALSAYGRLLMDAERYADAKFTLRRLIDLFGTYADNDAAYMMLAAAHRQLGEFERELAMVNGPGSNA